MPEAFGRNFSNAECCLVIFTIIVVSLDIILSLAIGLAFPPHFYSDKYVAGNEDSDEDYRIQCNCSGWYKEHMLNKTNEHKNDTAEKTMRKLKLNFSDIDNIDEQKSNRFLQNRPQFFPNENPNNLRNPLHRGSFELIPVRHDLPQVGTFRQMLQTTTITQQAMDVFDESPDTDNISEQSNNNNKQVKPSSAALAGNEGGGVGGSSNAKMIQTEEKRRSKIAVSNPERKATQLSDLETSHRQTSNHSGHQNVEYRKNHNEKSTTTAKAEPLATPNAAIRTRREAAIRNYPFIVSITVPRFIDLQAERLFAGTGVIISPRMALTSKPG